MQATCMPLFFQFRNPAPHLAPIISGQGLAVAGEACRKEIEVRLRCAQRSVMEHHRDHTTPQSEYSSHPTADTFIGCHDDQQAGRNYRGVALAPVSTIV